MQRVLITSGVLGLGSAIVFGAAALTATLFPNGPMVAAGMSDVWIRNGVGVGGGGVMMEAPAIKAIPIPMPAPLPPGVEIDDGDRLLVVPDR